MCASLTQVVRAEDARLVGDYTSMKQHYRALRDLNRDLCQQHDRRLEKHAQLASSLKAINGVIQSAIRLRLGAQTQALSNACRAAVQQQDSQAFIRALNHGT
jgi:Ciliary BBSome complex subunit 2, C-terminal